MTDRVPRLAAEAGKHGLGGIALVPGANLRYLTGLDFGLTKRLTLALFPAEGSPAFVVPALEAGRVEAGSRVSLRLFRWNDGDGPDAALRRCVDELGLAGKRIAVEHTAMRVMELRALEACAPGLSAEDATPLMTALRSRKDADERAAMREAVRMIETALEATIRQIRVGMTERALADFWDRQIRAAGSDGPAFATDVASGPNAANPHHVPGDRAFQAGDLIVLDGGALCRGYASDITRTVALGEPGPEARRIYELVQAANAAGRAACRPGATGEEIDRAARRVIEDGGCGPLFFHRTGHGLGLEIHEPPYIVAGSREPLPEGATFTIEPGIYLDGVRGVRIEDDLLLTPDGAESLTTFPRDLIVLPAA